jgi:hypothetical protein
MIPNETAAARIGIDMSEQDTPWEGLCSEAAWTFARRCVELHKSNPYDVIALDSIINTLMTELWDSGFSQSEIRTAFEKAIRDMPRYAANQERRGNGV